MRLLSEGKVKTELLIQGEIKLADIPAFFAANADKSNSCTAPTRISPYP